ncbi:hypothetical protein [Aquimarina longa]|uniref:hypothetical protein n=1 Tax=Aquimarina longa TaxID=1080221 RepID=UPI00130E5863|nr:hypothetical protein [Aquimarina longa]
MKNLDLIKVQELKTQEMTSINGGNLIVEVLSLAGAAFVAGWELGREYARG